MTEPPSVLFLFFFSIKSEGFFRPSFIVRLCESVGAPLTSPHIYSSRALFLRTSASFCAVSDSPCTGLTHQYQELTHLLFHTSSWIP